LHVPLHVKKSRVDEAFVQLNLSLGLCDWGALIRSYGMLFDDSSGMLFDGSFGMLFDDSIGWCSSDGGFRAGNRSGLCHAASLDTCDIDLILYSIEFREKLTYGR
jgi:hypothetical protein